MLFKQSAPRADQILKLVRVYEGREDYADRVVTLLDRAATFPQPSKVFATLIPVLLNQSGDALRQIVPKIAEFRDFILPKDAGLIVSGCANAGLIDVARTFFESLPDLTPELAAVSLLEGKTIAGYRDVGFFFMTTPRG